MKLFLILSLVLFCTCAEAAKKKSSGMSQSEQEKYATMMDESAPSKASKNFILWVTDNCPKAVPKGFTPNSLELSGEVEETPDGEVLYEFNVLSSIKKTVKVDGKSFQEESTQEKLCVGEDGKALKATKEDIDSIMSKGHPVTNRFLEVLEKGDYKKIESPKSVERKKNMRRLELIKILLGAGVTEKAATDAADLIVGREFSR